MGQRIAKHIYSSADVWEKSTCYIRDAQVKQFLGFAWQKFRNADPDRSIGSNVMAVISDYRKPVSTASCTLGATLTVDHYLPDVLSYTDYFVYGGTMNNRFTGGNVYRYGFQGQERDNELKGDDNSLNYEYRMHDPQYGRFMSIDPLATKYPHNSPYAFSENSLIAFVELEGLEKYFSVDGEFLGRVASENSDELRITKYSRDEGLAVFNNGNYEQDLYKNSIKAYTLEQENELVNDWAKEYRPQSPQYELGSSIISGQITDDYGKNIKVLVMGKLVGGTDPHSVKILSSTFEINHETIAYEERSSSSSLVFEWNFNKGAKANWVRHALIHSHTRGASDEFSNENQLFGLEGDVAVSLHLGINIYMVPFDHTWVKKFNPYKYKQEMKKQNPGLKFDQIPPDLDISKKVTEIIYPK